MGYLIKGHLKTQFLKFNLHIFYMRKMFLLFSFKNNFFLILHVNTSNKKRYLCKKKKRNWLLFHK